MPRFPVFLRARTDKTWDEVQADAQKDADDVASAPPQLKRAPSLMAQVGELKKAATSATGSSAASATTCAAAASSATAAASAAAPAPLKRTGSGLLWSAAEGAGKVGAVVARAEAHPASKKPKSTAAVAAAVECEPKLTRSTSQTSAVSHSSVVEDAHGRAVGGKAGDQQAVPQVAVGNGLPAKRAKLSGWQSPAERAALAAKMRKLVKDKEWDAIQILVSGKACKLRNPQRKALDLWADLRKFDREYLFVAKDGVPHHFESMDGVEMRIVLDEDE